LPKINKKNIGALDTLPLTDQSSSAYKRKNNQANTLKIGRIPIYSPNKFSLKQPVAPTGNGNSVQSSINGEREKFYNYSQPPQFPQNDCYLDPRASTDIQPKIVSV
jgi:hypothetical protein